MAIYLPVSFQVFLPVYLFPFCSLLIVAANVRKILVSSSDFIRPKLT